MATKTADKPNKSTRKSGSDKFGKDTYVKWYKDINHIKDLYINPIEK